MLVREANGNDRDAIRGVHGSAFPESERDVVAKLAVDLLSEHTEPRVLSLVAETDGEVVGHTTFSPVAVDGEEDWAGYILAPLGVRPEFQKRGVGSRLVEQGLQELSERDVDLVLVYGDPDYYGRFGFRADTATDYVPPYELQYPFGWQARVLREHRPRTRPVSIRCVNSLRDSAIW